MKYTIPEKTLDVELHAIHHTKGVNVVVVFRPIGTPTLDPHLTVVIDGDRYQELLSANPPWAPNKPAGVFRDDDVLKLLGVRND